ncbi:hypothetical protein CLV59_104174 [Chitinophaga dinghuensis]|uniref:Fimbrillin-A associated anchor protein Mfa1/Mfa2 n=1 Tax=Chitinophaga dinghuensis TaxID=1539050 RepID=A0A327VYA8_9BACT|nr:hypothetical protein [Chitinophaga dinghuensis]RAJ81949.1 hypothetical protein CLV59_104174 [Chitinophaga dinghuensis]
MKTPRFLVLGSLILISVLYACKKNDSAPAPGKTNPGWSGEMVNVKLKLSGDLQAEASPLGRQAVNARINPDSTIYAVDVRWGNFNPYAQGIFTSLDSLTLNLPKGPFFTIRVAAIKKGSGLGLFEITDSLTNTRFLPGTPLNRSIGNRLYTDSTGPNQVFYAFLDTLTFFRVATSAYGYEESIYSELDTYYGQYQGYLTESTLTIPLKRFTYGIRFKPENFSDGSLLVDYGYMAAPKTIPVSNLANRAFTYTAHDYTYGDNLWRDLPVSLRLLRTNGTIQNLGSITLRPKRNTLTTISITAPNSGVPLGISISENSWRQDTTVVIR